MKKRFAALAAGALAALSATCLASIPVSQISLGGVEPGISVERARVLCGETTYEDEDTLMFANGLIVKMDESRPDVVEEVIAKKTGIPTPAGIAVGMREVALNGAYGKADHVDKDISDTEYTYHSDDRTKKMEIKVKDGVIIKIKCELRD